MKRPQKGSKPPLPKLIRLGGMAIRCVTDPTEIATFDARLDGKHYLG